MFFLNPNSGIPLYVQLFQQCQQRILSGQWPQGTQLPSVRDLSAQLHINPLTVAKVYQMLERADFIETKRGVGSYVSHQASELKFEARRAKIAPAVEQVVTEALHLGLSEPEVQTLLSEKFIQLQPKINLKHPHE